MGIVIGEKEYWGKGIAQEAIQSLIKSLPGLGIRRISAELEEGNVAVEKVLIKSGFLKETDLKASRMKDGHPINTVRYFFLVSDSGLD